VVNGVTSRIIYIGAWINIALVGLCITYLSAHSKATPAELQMALTGAFGVIAGSHIKPPISPKATKAYLEAEGQ